MKAIITSSEALDTPLPEIRLVADSAVGRQSEPYWLDDCNHASMTVLLCPCYRIGRLGKNIAPEFTARYIDAVTVAAVILPAGNAADVLHAPQIHFIANSAVIPGDDIAVNVADTAEFTISCSQSSRLLPAKAYCEKAVSRLSEIATFKTGDRIIDCSNPIAIEVEGRCEVEAEIDNKKILKIRFL